MLKKLLTVLTGRSKDTPVFRLGDAGKATHSIIRIDERGHTHEHLVGRTGYGKCHEPIGGHKPDTVILSNAHDDTYRLLPPGYNEAIKQAMQVGRKSNGSDPVQREPERSESES